MRVEYHKSFTKKFRKLNRKTQDKVTDVVNIFRHDPHDPSLRNHALKGSMLGKRAFSVTGDLRVVFEEIDDYVLVIMLDVGTHNQVYQ